MVAPDYPAVAPVFALSVKWQSERHALNDFHIQVSTVNPQIFMRILFSQIALKRHICDAKNFRLGHDFPILVISPFCEDFIFTKLHICFAFAKFFENKTFVKISKFTVYAKMSEHLECNSVIIFLSTSQIICFGCSKEPSCTLMEAGTLSTVMSPNIARPLTL